MAMNNVTNMLYGFSGLISIAHLEKLREDVKVLQGEMKDVQDRVSDQETLVDEAVSRYRLGQAKSQKQM